MHRVPGGRAVFLQGLAERLKAHAERAFALAAIDENGVSLEETLTGLLARARTPARRAKLEAELAVPPMPAALGYLVAVFRRLAARRQNSGFGPQPIPLSEIAALQSLAGVRLAPWEVEIIEALDDLHLASLTPQRTSPEP